MRSHQHLLSKRYQTEFHLGLTYINYSVITGGKDCKINILDASNYNKLHTFDLQTTVKNSLSAQVRSAFFSADNKTILVGTYGSEIYELQSK